MQLICNYPKSQLILPHNNANARLCTYEVVHCAPPSSRQVTSILIGQLTKVEPTHHYISPGPLSQCDHLPWVQSYQCEVTICVLESHKIKFQNVKWNPPIPPTLRLQYDYRTLLTEHTFSTGSTWNDIV